MDDLDHSMHISNYDWLTFLEESEECCLLQPSLACPDSSCLSDADDLDLLIETTPVNINAEEKEEGSEETKIREEEVSIVKYVEDQAGQQPAESNLKSKQEPELAVMTGAFRGDCVRTEKERWFVTVNADPSQHHVPLVKKKKPKKIWKEDIKSDQNVCVGASSDTVESAECVDDDFFSSCSNDSENYHSAAESVEESHCLPNSPLNLPRESIHADHLADGAMQLPDKPLTSNGATIGRHQSTGSQTSHIYPSACHSTDTTPKDHSTCEDGTKSTELGMFVDTPTSASNSSSSIRDQPESPEVTVDSPEAYARVTGNTQAVYAISAFWDEMEKFTINDILQIRMGRCMLPVEEASDEPQGCTSATVNPESATLDLSDTADSDYCTHLDESKPDRSSCDFSTSDFEEEYWQFLNSSRNSSPDRDDESYQSLCTEDSDGTPVPSVDGSGQQLSRDSTFSLCDLPLPQQIRKNKSMYDISALSSMEELSMQSSLERSSCESPEKPLKMSNSLEVETAVMCLTDEQYQISFPKVFEYLFTDNNAKYEAMSLSVYGLQEMPTSPVHDYALSPLESDMSHLSYSEDTIPIFSCSYPTVRELTFHKPGSIFLGTTYSSMKDISPIQIVSQSLIRSMDYKHTDRSYSFSQDLSSLFSIKKICFQEEDWVDASDVWRYQVENDKRSVETIGSNMSVVCEEEDLSVTTKIFSDAALRQLALESNRIPTDYQSIFSTINQSDMCLVCIAFASWVLRSSDPEAADAWKAALLANVSALSAIQYLRQYMKKRATPPDDL